MIAALLWLMLAMGIGALLCEVCYWITREAAEDTLALPPLDLGAWLAARRVEEE